MSVTVKSTTGTQITVAAITMALPAFVVNPGNGDTIVVCQAWFLSSSSNTAAPTDSAGNTYTRVNPSDIIWGAFTGVTMWKAENIIGGSSFIVTVRMAVNACTQAAVARCITYTLPSSNRGDATTNQTNGTTSATTAAPGPGGGQPNSVYIACVSDGQTDPASYTSPPGWTNASNQLNNSSSQDIGTVDKVILDQQLPTGVWTGPNTSFGAYGAIIASFAGPYLTSYVTGRWPGVMRRIT